MFNFSRRHPFARFCWVMLPLGAALWLGATGRYQCYMPGREARLLCAINSNVGYGHMTRGMNTYTIEALDRVATYDDILVLQWLLMQDDRVAAMTVAEVLKNRGKKGHDALMAAFKEAKDSKNDSRADLINEYGDLHQKLY